MNLPINYMDVVQGTEDWFRARCGSVTSSKIGAIVAKRSRGIGELSDRRDCRIDMVWEILNGKTAEHYVSKWMKRGIELEPSARMAYEMERGVTVQQIGYVLHPTIKMAGASWDGYIGENGLVEFKCPKDRTHMEYMLAGIVPPEYVPQMMWQMACDPAREWNDFCSYHPEADEKHQTFICRLERDDKLIAEMEQEAIVFLAEVEDAVERLRNQRAVPWAEYKVQAGV